MYLKQIKTTGFKSFADKISISLDDDITCIVGPNGSGKSNIVDAVKWVLGEQSVKNLRGSNNMTDVIFSGSKTRSPLNLASVTLVFDNSDSYIKVPYTEISITRKVYRSGENEYYINNEKCRLKDISDLFLDSGMGKYAFNIISQGEVSKIISDSPVDRRAIFEEAAGVLKYKRRKEEALRKLEKTNENLTRVNDITKELEERIEPLKEQSEKAEQYLDTKKKLEDIEIALITNDLEKLNIEYSQGLEKQEEIENKISELSNNETKSDLNLSIKKQEQINISNKLVALNNDFLSLTKEEEKLNGERNIIKERSKYNAEDVKIHDNLANLKEQSLSLHNKLLSLKTDAEIISNKIKDATTLILKQQKAISETTNIKNNIEVIISKDKKSLVDVGYKISALTSYIENNSASSPAVRKVLTNPKLKGIHNIISKLISVDESYAIAVDVALASAKDYIVVDNPTNAKMAINYLKDNNYGRATFYPLEVIKPRFVDTETKNIVKNQEGFISILADLINYDPIYKNIIYNQLGNVLLIDNLDHANEISKKINNKYRMVTLQGEIINVGGSITGGSLNKKSIINEKYELQNLKSEEQSIKERIAINENKVEELVIKLKKDQTTSIETEKSRLILNEELKNKNTSYNNITKEYDKVSLELSNLNDLESGSLVKEEEKIIAKYYEVLHKKEDIEKQISIADETKERITSEIEELEASYRLNNQTSRTLENNLKNQELSNAKISTKMDNLLEILSESYSMTFEKAKASYILEIEEDIARKTVNELRNIIKKIGDVNTLAIEEYERVNTRYNFLKKQSDDLKEAMGTLLRIIDELDKVMASEFIKTFKDIEVEFNNVFKELFGGGTASLKLTDKENILETGIDIVVTPPGKKVSSISLLSGGEKTLTAISFLFSILNIKKIPFCIFDEVEAALDEANVEKVGAYFKKYANRTQLIIITHKKKTMEYANTLYGITMQESGVSKLVSVKLV